MKKTVQNVQIKKINPQTVWRIKSYVDHHLDFVLNSWLQNGMNTFVLLKKCRFYERITKLFIIVNNTMATWMVD